MFFVLQKREFDRIDDKKLGSETKEELNALREKQEEKEKIRRRNERIEKEMKEEASEQFDELLNKFDENRKKMMKEANDHLKKKVKEEREARDRVLAQIEADKAERKSLKTPTTSTTVASSSSSSTVDMSRTKLMIRQRNGETLSSSFDSNTTLAEVRQYVETNT